MASPLVAWRRLLGLRTRVADGEALLLKAAEGRLAHSEHVYASFAYAGEQGATGASLAASQAARDASWQQMQRMVAEVAEHRLRWQRAKREQRQAELLLERHTAALEARRERRERDQQDNWLRARVSAVDEGEG